MTTAARKRGHPREGAAAVAIAALRREHPDAIDNGGAS